MENVMKEGTFKVHVNLVSDSEKYVGRVNFDIDESLCQLDENGVESFVQQFSLQSFAMRQQLKAVSKDYCKYLLLANGHLESGQVGMLLFGAELEIKRVLRHKDEPRQYGEGTYERDVYSTEIVSVTVNKEEALLDDLKASIRENKALSHIGSANLFA